MQRLLSAPDLGWFDHNWEQVNAFCQQRGFAGLEVFAPEAEGCLIPEGLVKGVHLSYWLTPWLTDRKNNAGDFRSVHEEMVDTYVRELDRAGELGASYVVCHGGYVELAHAFDDEFPYTDEEVIEAITDLADGALRKSGANVAFLFENLWWPGLTLMQPALALSILEGIQHQNKGLVLDTGHLMNTNPRLTTELEAVAYVENVVARLDGSGESIRAVHLHKSVGSRLSPNEKSRMQETYQEALTLDEQQRVVMHAIAKLDEHRPFEGPAIGSLIQNLAPEYLVYELSARSLEELERSISIQDTALGWFEELGIE